MSLFRSSLRPPAPISDEVIERYLAAIRAGLEPDPLFRRRLRGHVVNRFVAAREGLATTRTPVAREVGRLGRAVLYASFALGISVTGAMAASQQAIPGDAFYGVKLEIERLRLQILPRDLHGDLSAYTLGERIEELRRLTESGNWSAASVHVGAVEAAYDQVIALSPDPETLAGRLAVPGALFQRLPEKAQEALDATFPDSPDRGGGKPTGEDRPTDDGASSDGGDASGPNNGRGHGSGGGGSGEPPAADPPDAPGRSSSEAANPTPPAEPRATSPGQAERSNPSTVKPPSLPAPPERP